MTLSQRAGARPAAATVRKTSHRATAATIDAIMPIDDTPMFVAVMSVAMVSAAVLGLAIFDLVTWATG